MFKTILLCTHGTPGAMHAERLVFSELYEEFPEIKIIVLSIIDEDWRDMTGDDWLNSSKTHTDFLNHVEQQMRDENEEDWQRIKKTHPAAAMASFISVVGPIEDMINSQARKLDCDLIVIGPWRKSRRLFNLKMEKGLRARIDPAKLQQDLPCPLLISNPLKPRK